jgi:hypothetical protein
VTTTPRTADLPEGQAPSSLVDDTQALTALTPIKPGRREQLQQVLAGVGKRIAAGGPTPLDDIGTVHFARWVILPDYGEGGGLLFATNYDGTFDDYIRDFAERASDSFEAIYSNCVGWPAGGATDLEAFRAYIRAHELVADVSYRAYPVGSVRQVKSALRLKKLWLALVDELNE